MVTRTQYQPRNGSPETNHKLSRGRWEPDGRVGWGARTEIPAHAGASGASRPGKMELQTLWPLLLRSKEANTSPVLWVALWHIKERKNSCLCFLQLWGPNSHHLCGTETYRRGKKPPGGRVSCVNFNFYYLKLNIGTTGWQSPVTAPTYKWES